jgi:hypothetical protein
MQADRCLLRYFHLEVSTGQVGICKVAFGEQTLVSFQPERPRRRTVISEPESGPSATRGQVVSFQKLLPQAHKSPVGRGEDLLPAKLAKKSQTGEPVLPIQPLSRHSVALHPTVPHESLPTPSVTSSSSTVPCGARRCPRALRPLQLITSKVIRHRMLPLGATRCTSRVDPRLCISNLGLAILRPPPASQTPWRQMN